MNEYKDKKSYEMAIRTLEDVVNKLKTGELFLSSMTADFESFDAKPGQFSPPRQRTTIETQLNPFFNSEAARVEKIDAALDEVLQPATPAEWLECDKCGRKIYDADMIDFHLRGVGENFGQHCQSFAGGAKCRSNARCLGIYRIENRRL